MECISISHKTAKSTERQRCFIAKEAADAFLQELMKVDRVEQCVLLSTCNRTEIYVQGEENLFGKLEERVAETTGNSVEWVRSLVRRYQGWRALRHLFYVSCGMESMVIGEDEILGQVRTAYIRSKESGWTGYELNMAFQAALACAKRVKTETMLSKTSVSVATLAAREVFRLPLSQKTVLLMGSSGQMGSIILKDLLSQQEIQVIATTRSHHGMYQSSSPQVKNVDYQDRYQYFDAAEAVISATSRPHYTVTAGRVKEAIKTTKERLFLDISMPPDMDEDIGRLEHCHLISLDDINRLAAENNIRKQQAIADAQEILEEELNRICNVLAFHCFANEMDCWREAYTGYSAEKLIYLLRDKLDSSSFEAVLRVLKER